MFAHEAAKGVDVQTMVSRGKDRQVLFCESEQTYGRLQTPAVFWMPRVLEIFLQMDESASRLNQAFEIIVIVGVAVQPELLQNIMRFVIMLLVPAPEIRAVERMIGDVDCRWIDLFANQFPHELRNPLAFVHVRFNLVWAQMMGKPRDLVFAEDSSGSFRGGEKE